MAPKKNTRPTDTDTDTDTNEETRELSPQESQMIADGANHGVRQVSRAELVREIGADKLHANELAAEKIHGKRGHADTLRKNHGR